MFSFLNLKVFFSNKVVNSFANLILEETFAAAILSYPFEASKFKEFPISELIQLKIFRSQFECKNSFFSYPI